MNKIGIMGGSFDPPHIGHLFMAEYAKNEFCLSKVIFVPTGKVYYKDMHETTADDRMNMTRIAIEDNPCFEISDIESKDDEYSYTADTLLKLSRIYGDAELFFIVGADSLDYMENWKNPEQIFSLCTVLAVGRAGYSEERCRAKAKKLTELFSANICFVDMPVIEVSSSGIRNKLREGKSVKYEIPDSVSDYISKKNLYIGENQILSEKTKYEGD